MRNLILFALFALLGACDIDVVEEWHLDHDRVIAVRATPPGIVSGQTSELDALLGHEDSAPMEAIPDEATVVSPRSLASALAFTNGRWVVTAPDDATLASVRVELGLAPTVPVPLVVSVSWPASTFPSDTIGADYTATKTVVLGEERMNPVISTMTVDGTSVFEASELVVDATEETTLAVPAEREDVTRWLSSCGQLADWDLASTLLTFETDDSRTGNISVVRRTRAGGVAWKTWAIRAE
jgi:hypothetical protein